MLSRLHTILAKYCSARYRSRLCFALVLLLAAAGIALAQNPAEPVTPNASPEAHALLRAINRISGRNTLSGQHNFANTQSAYTEQVQKDSGKTPVIWSSDFGFAATGNDAITARDAIIAEAKRQFNDGSIIALTWPRWAAGSRLRSARSAPFLRLRC
ncbi:MAG: hypothetical protein ABSC60_06865 [Acidobacteriota bacterium]